MGRWRGAIAVGDPPRGMEMPVKYFAIASLIGAIALLPQGVSGSSDSCTMTNAPCSAKNTAPPSYNGPTMNDFIESQSTAVYFDQYQMVGSHNSFHQQPDTGIMAPMTLADYSQPSLQDQLDIGVREIELDLHFNESHFEVYHIGVIDDLSSCKCLSDCLASMKRWSDANPDHTPVVVSLEPKGFQDPLEPLWCDPEESDCASRGYDVLKEQIVSAGLSLILPEEIRGSHSSMREALAAGVHKRSVDCDCESSDCDCQDGGWPMVSDMLGKFIFYLNFDKNNEGCRSAYEQHGGLEVFFDMAKDESVETDSRFSAFIYVGDLEEDVAIIASLGDTGYIVRQGLDATLGNSDSVAGHAEQTAANIFAYHTFSDLVIDPSRDFEDSNYWSMGVIGAAALLCLCMLYCCVPIFSSTPNEDGADCYAPAYTVETEQLGQSI